MLRSLLLSIALRSNGRSAGLDHRHRCQPRRLCYRGVGGSVDGEFTDYEAAITLDPSDLANARIEACVGTASGSTGNGQLDDSMLGEEGLHRKAMPLRVSSRKISARPTPVMKRTAR